METVMNLFKSFGQETSLDPDAKEKKVKFSNELEQPQSILRKQSYGLDSSMDMDNNSTTYSTPQHYSNEEPRRKSLKKRLSSVFCILRCNQRSKHSLSYNRPQSSPHESTALNSKSISSPETPQSTSQTSPSLNGVGNGVGNGFEVSVPDQPNFISPLRGTDEIGAQQTQQSKSSVPSTPPSKGTGKEVDDPHDLLGSSGCDLPSYLNWENVVQVLSSPNISDFKKYMLGEDDIAVPGKENKANRQKPENDDGVDGRLKKGPNNSLMDQEEDDETEADTKADGDTKTDADSTFDNILVETYEKSGDGDGPDMTDWKNEPKAPVSHDSPVTPRPHEEEYDATFTIRFLKEITTTGIMLVYYKNSSDMETDEMMPSLINLFIKPGNARGTVLLEPRLFWTELTSNPSITNDEQSISLLDIYSIYTSLSEAGQGQIDDQNQESSTTQPEQQDPPNSFFTITSNSGQVHAFEAPTTSERNYTVAGIKNIVAWLTHNLISGSMTSSMTLMKDVEDENGVKTGELPSLRTPVQAMNEITHSFLD